MLLYERTNFFFFKEVWRIIYISLVNFTWKTKRKTREKKGEFFLLLLFFLSERNKKSMLYFIPIVAFPVFINAQLQTRFMFCLSVYLCVIFIILLSFFSRFHFEYITSTNKQTNNNILFSCWTYLKKSLCQLFSFFLTKKIDTPIDFIHSM